MNIEHLREFLTLAETLNFTKTAEQHYITQPVLSRHIRALEDELGSVLFERSTHQVSLTDNGKYAYSKLNRLLDNYDEVLLDIKNHNSETTASLNLGILHFGINAYLDRLIAAVNQARPGTEINVFPMHANDVSSALFSNEIDLGLTVAPAICGHEGLTFFEVAEEPLMLMAPASSDLTSLSDVELADLCCHRIVLSKREPWQKLVLVEELEAAGLNFDDLEISETEQVELLPQALVRCGGVALVPAHIGTMGSDQVVLIPVKENPCISIGCLYRSDSKAFPLIERLRDVIESETSV